MNAEKLEMYQHEKRTNIDNIDRYLILSLLVAFVAIGVLLN